MSTIHRNGRIRPEFTGDDIASAMAVRGSTIVAVGTEAAVAAAVEAGATVIDLNGRCVIPGLTDVHTHVAGHALDEKCVELRDTCDPTVTSVAVMLERMAEVAAIREPGELVIGIGAMRQNTRLAERRWPSLALERGGIDRHTQDPPAGKIERDQETGEATGTLLETAKETVIQEPGLPTTASSSTSTRWKRRCCGWPAPGSPPSTTSSPPAIRFAATRCCTTRDGCRSG